MLKEQVIEYVGNILNIKIENELVYFDIAEELENISNFANIIDFKNFLKKNIKHSEVAYLTGFQKFFKLSEMFTEKSLAYISEGVEEKARSLKERFTSVFTMKTKEHLLNDNFQFKFIQSDGVPFFTVKELFILDKLNKHRLYTALNDTGLLEAIFLEEYKQQAEYVKRIKQTPQLENKTDAKVLALAKRAVA